MAKYTVTLSAAEEKALGYIAYDIQAWIDNAVHNRARQAIDEIVTDHSDKQPKKLTPAAKEQIVNGAVVQNLKDK